MSLRNLLFLKEAELRTGTPTGYESILYDQMIRAFGKAIESIDK